MVKRFTVILILVTLAAACSPSYGMGGLPANSANARATLDMAQSMAVGATAEAQRQANAIAQAQGATRESLALEGTAQAQDRIATTAAVEAAATATASGYTLQATATALAQVAIAEELAVTREAQRLEIANREAEAKVTRGYILTAAIGLAVVMFAAATVYIVLAYARPRVIPRQAHEDLVAPAFYRVLAAAPTPTEERPLLPAPDPEDRPLPKAANWTAFSQWRDPRRLPIGADAQGPILLDLDKAPHYMAAGRTGTGKTRRFGYPVIAAALASGHNVILVNESGSDFRPFKLHPLARNVAGNMETAAADAAHVLERLVEEMSRREGILKAQGVSTWDRLPSPDSGEILVFIDEFLMLARRLQSNKANRDRLMEAAIALTSQGRKFGIRLAITVTSPTERALGPEGLTIRDQCARVCFAVEDEATSRVMLGGRNGEAANLPNGEFIASFNGETRHGVTFAPTNGDVRTYLDAAPTQPPTLPALVDQGIRETRNPREETVDLTAQVDAQALIEAGPFTSRHKAAQYLSGRTDTRANGEDFDRADAALIIAATYEKWAEDLLRPEDQGKVEEAMSL